MHDIIFNESLSGCLGILHSLFYATNDISSLNISACPIRAKTCTAAGQEFDDVIHLKEFHKAEHACQKKQNNGPSCYDLLCLPMSFHYF